MQRGCSYLGKIINYLKFRSISSCEIRLNPKAAKSQINSFINLDNCLEDNVIEYALVKYSILNKNHAVLPRKVVYVSVKFHPGRLHFLNGLGFRHFM